MRFLLTLVMALTLYVGAFGNTPQRTVNELRDICRESLKKRDFHTAHSAAVHLRSLSLKENNEIGLGNANYYLGATEVYLGVPDSARIHLNEALRIAEKHDNDSLKGLALNALGMYETSVNANYSVGQYYFIKSLDYPEAARSASINLAQIALLQKDTSGAEYARRTYDYGIKENDVHSCYISLLSLVKFAMLDNDFEKALKLLGEMMVMTEKYNYTDMERLKLLKADILSQTGHTAESTQLLDSIRPAIEKKSPNQLATLLFVKGMNLHLDKQYAASNKVLMEAIEVANESANITSLVKTYELIADNYKAMGNGMEAFQNLYDAFELSEKTAQADQQRMIDERKLILDVIKEEQQRELAEEKARYNGRLSIILGLLLVLAATTIVIVILNLRRRNRLYRHIVQQNVAMLENEEKYKTRIKELETQPTAPPVSTPLQEKASEAEEGLPHPEKLATPEKEEAIPESVSSDSERKGGYTITEEKSKRLFATLQALMEDEALYRNPQLTREEVLDLLKTNSTYLAQIIKDNTGMNYSQYVNSFRMRDALKALSDKDRIEVPIKDIALESGFNSLTTFYKLFQQATGISPTAYRRSLASMA